MDKIYSRKRIKIPTIKRMQNKQVKKLLKVFIILLISAFTFYTSLTAINPIFEELCVDKAGSIVIDTMNEESTAVLKKYNYQDIVSIIKNENTNILKTNVVVINNIATEITRKIIDRLQELENSTIKIPIGAFTGNKLLIGAGPNVNIKIMPIGSVRSEIKTEFQEQGINQTTYRIYLDITCGVKILMPYENVSREIKSQILLVETAVVGEVPETYYNLEGITKEETLEMIT